MTPFDYTRAATVQDAIGCHKIGTQFLAGGTNLIDLMKENVTKPARLIDINQLPLRKIESLDKGGLRLGALVTNTDTAYHPEVERRYPLLASAILAGASPQLRNAATNGGNLNQRTRCYYFYDTATACNKRETGSGCGAIGGVNRMHAILGTSETCIATHPSDMCVALAALGAVVQVEGPNGRRAIPFLDYHRLPGDEPERDNTLEPGELVTAIDLPAEEFTSHYTYLKIRDRLSYAFALISVAAALHMDGNRITTARIALGGVAHKPWRAPSAEALLEGNAGSVQAYEAAADTLLEGARGQGGNDFKIELARRTIVRALTQAASGTPQSQIDKRIA